MLTQKHSLNLLRITLGVVFIWFGALKLIDMSPIREIVMASTPALLRELPGFFFILGLVEVAIGTSFILGKGIKLAAITMILHLLMATVLVLISRGFNPFFPILTLEGEFVIKNAVLIAAASLFIAPHEQIAE